MDTIALFGPIVQQVLEPFADLQYAHGDFHNELVFDNERGRYVVMSVGWDKTKRVHGSIVHIDIIGDKVWVQRDGTDYGIVNTLEEAGIPKDRIVLGFHPEDVRPLTGYAVK